MLFRSMVYRGVASGEYLVGLSYENAGGDIRRFGSDVALVYPEDGSSAVPDGVALIRGAAHPAEARAFMDFVLGQDVARVMVYRFGRRSARLDIPEPDGLPPLSSLRLVDYDFGAAARERENTIARFESMLGVFNANRKAGQ